MKYLILIAIRIYWLIPKNRRPRCLYKESCSNYVYRHTKENGFIKGIKSLAKRIRTCNPHYRVINIDDQQILICSNGDTIEDNQIADWLFEP